MDIYWLWLTSVKGVGPVTQRKLVRALGTPQAVYEAKQKDLETVQGLRKTIINNILQSRSLEDVKRVLEKMQRHGIQLLTFTDPDFPPRVNAIPNLPAVIFYRGSLRSPNYNVGIVGSRRCTSYGKQVASEAAAFLAHEGVTVVSGLAKGIDSYAHTACIKANGYTLAFVANGLDLCYPPEHRTLMEEIAKSGAILSSYPPGTRPFPEYFPLRNKLLSAWIDKLLVVESGERSGALITAHYAKEYQRQVLAVPNDIYSPESVGANRLLQSGAEIYLEPQQLLREPSPQGPAFQLEQPKSTKSKVKTVGKISPAEQEILELLQHPILINELAAKYKGDVNDLISLLSIMEIEGKIKISGQLVSGV